MDPATGIAGVRSPSPPSPRLRGRSRFRLRGAPPSPLRYDAIAPKPEAKAEKRPLRRDGGGAAKARPSPIGYVFSAMVGTARCAVPARVVAGGTNIRATLAFEGIAPLHAARTSQRDVPTTLNRYSGEAGGEEGRFLGSPSRLSSGGVSGFPIVACPAVHYAAPEDRRRYDILQSIRTLTLLEHEHPGKRRGGRYHFRAPAEMAAGCAPHPEWLRATREIAERCDFTFPFGKPQFPAFKAPDGSSSKEFLRHLVRSGLRRRYTGKRIISDTGTEVPLAQVRAQVEEELSIIADVGYEGYFLITWDFLQDCRRRGIEWITRGSAADSLVCYCLGISGVCPVRFGLYFRRFLNKERMALNKLPDIDIDFAHDFKDDVVKLIFEKYGREHCAVVGGFSTFQARSAFAEVAKVRGVGEREVRKFTERFPWGFGGGWVPDGPAPKGGAGLIELLRASPETRDLPFDEEPYQTALQMAEFLDGMPRYPKMHPCGLVLSRQPMHELTPTFISNKGCSTTHFDMDAVEAIGLVKMDILAQGGLAAMRDVKAMLAKRGIEVDLQHCLAREKGSGKLEPSHLEGLAENSLRPPNDMENRWSQLAQGRPTILPLPGGEGRGEGELR